MLTAFAYLLDTVRVDANTVFGKEKKQLSALEENSLLDNLFVPM